jgi:cardiolipin synthase
MKKKMFLQKNFNLPNLVTFVRILLIVPFVLYIIEEKYLNAGIVLVFSAITDLLDGFLAKKLKLTTIFGEMFDPMADKLTLIAVMICVGAKFNEVIPFIAITLTKEILMLVASALLLKNKKRPFAAKWYGKLGTALFYVSIVTIISLKAIWGYQNETVTFSLMFITSLFMIFALVKYFKLFLNTFNWENLKFKK